jgi:hypothetical protein
MEVETLTTLLLGYWTVETDCGPCLRLVRRTSFTDLPDVEGPWIYPEDAGLPRYCDDWDDALRVLLPLAVESVREHLA